MNLHLPLLSLSIVASIKFARQFTAHHIVQLKQVLALVFQKLIAQHVRQVCLIVFQMQPPILRILVKS